MGRKVHACRMPVNPAEATSDFSVFLSTTIVHYPRFRARFSG
jgi:hypothetical protein